MSIATWLRRVSALVLLLAAPYARAVFDPSTGEDSTSGDLVGTFTESLGQYTVLFGTFAVACILVTGFFLGRKWLRSVG